MKNKDSYFKCFFEPITLYKKIVIEFIFNKVRGEVLEIGSGEAPWFWALSYMHNADSILFTDIKLQYLEDFFDFVQTIDEDSFYESTKDVISFINSINRECNTSSKLFLENLVTKTETKQIDFSQDFHLNTRFDTILSIEAIECVNSLEDLQIAFKSIYRHLKPEGKFIGVALPYTKQNEKVKNLIDKGLEGKLNPGKEEFLSVGEDIGFNNIKIKTKKTGKTFYPEVLLITMQK